MNKTYKVTAKILTPLSIGKGAENDWVNGMDFLVNKEANGENYMYHLDLMKMIEQGIDVRRLAQLFASKQVHDIQRLIGSKLPKVSDFRMRIPLSNNANIDTIKTQLRNPLSNRPIIAGSSLKGALRSILFKSLSSGGKNEQDVFGKLKDGEDFMRFIQVGDFEFEKTYLFNTKIYNLRQDKEEYKKGDNEDKIVWQGGWKHAIGVTSPNFKQTGFNTLYECLPPDAEAVGRIVFSDVALFNRLPTPQKYDDKKIDLLQGGADKLCDIIIEHTWTYIDKEYTFFETFYHGEYSTNVRDQLNLLFDTINDCAPNECVLKMSAGSGFHSITGDWQFDEYIDTPENRFDRKRNGVLPKSRKIVVSGTKQFAPMGFVKLTFTEDK